MNQLVWKLESVFGKDRVLTQKTDLMTYSYDASFATQLEPKEPEIVVIPMSTEEVSTCTRLANEYLSTPEGRELPKRGDLSLFTAALSWICPI